MITAVDTSVLLDVFTADARHGAASKEVLSRCLGEGGLVACEIVWAEVAASFGTVEGAGRALDLLTIEFDAADRGVAAAAGAAWRRYRASGGARQRILADFLIGAHASARADRLLTRDRGFYRSYFRGLTVLEP